MKSTFPELPEGHLLILYFDHLIIMIIGSKWASTLYQGIFRSTGFQKVQKWAQMKGIRWRASWAIFYRRSQWVLLVYSVATESADCPWVLLVVVTVFENKNRRIGFSLKSYLLKSIILDGTNVRLVLKSFFSVSYTHLTLPTIYSV